MLSNCVAEKVDSAVMGMRTYSTSYPSADNFSYTYSKHVGQGWVGKERNGKGREGVVEKEKQDFFLMCSFKMRKDCADLAWGQHGTLTIHRLPTGPHGPQLYLVVDCVWTEKWLVNYVLSGLFERKFGNEFCFCSDDPAPLPFRCTHT